MKDIKRKEKILKVLNTLEVTKQECGINKDAIVRELQDDILEQEDSKISLKFCMLCTGSKFLNLAAHK